MKSIVKHEMPIGADGAKAAGELLVEDGMIKAKVEVSFPLEKVLAPAQDVINNMVDKLEKAIPGDWDKPYAEQIKKEAIAELAKRLSE
jgi:hypothetical protein